jgi:hypothetical protein
MKSIPGHDEVELVEKQLFQSLKGDEPSVKARHVAAAALGLGSAALTGATAAEGAAVASAAVKASPLLLVKWVGIGTVVGVASIGAVHYAMPRSPAMAPKAVATIAAAASPQAPSTIARPDPVAAPPETTQPEDPPAIAQQLHAPRPTSDIATNAASAAHAARASSPGSTAPGDRAAQARATDDALANPPAAPTPVTTPSMLAAEVAMLDQARGAVAAKSGERALDVLNRYARQFPSGTLNLEATVLRIEALYLTGSTAAATALGRDFLAAHSTSTHASHVRSLLAEHEKP